MQRFYTTFSLTGRECGHSFINSLGYSDARTRADSPRHPRFAPSESRLSGPALRLRHSAAHPTDFTGSAADRTGRALPCAVSTGAAGIAEGSLGHVGEQSTDQVLRTDNRRAETLAPGGRRLEPPSCRHCLSAKGAAGGNMRIFASLRSIISALFHRSLVEKEIEEELRAHIQDR